MLPCEGGMTCPVFLAIFDHEKCLIIQVGWTFDDLPCIDKRLSMGKVNIYLPRTYACQGRFYWDRLEYTTIHILLALSPMGTETTVFNIVTSKMTQWKYLQQLFDANWMGHQMTWYVTCFMIQCKRAQCVCHGHVALTNLVAIESEEEIGERQPRSDHGVSWGHAIFQGVAVF